MNPHAATFETYYQGNDDPWGFRSRFYEKRKRDLLLASLPQERFGSCWEIGCSNGELAASLAERCDQLLATDGNERAVSLAHDRLAHLSHARVKQSWVPGDWPDQAFDLIVLSEVAYYLSVDDLKAFMRQLTSRLSKGGVFAACHWRASIDGCELDGNGVHFLLTQSIPLHHACSHVEPDFLLDIWSWNEASVAMEEGLR